MTAIVFDCDRCGRVTKAAHNAEATSGFYDVDGPYSWSRFGRPGEHFVCDSCIWAMPEYQAEFGERE